MVTDEEYQELKERVEKLEEAIFVKKQVSKIEEDFKGLNGGINLLIKNGFFSTSKSLNETNNELAKEGYHYGRGAISKALSVYFFKNKKTLTRIKSEKNWKYVLRK